MEKLKIVQMDLGRQKETLAEIVHFFDFAKKYGVEPWVYYKNENAAVYDAAIESGARLFTANDSAWAMEYLRKKGLHR